MKLETVTIVIVAPKGKALSEAASLLSEFFEINEKYDQVAAYLGNNEEPQEATAGDIAVYEKQTADARKAEAEDDEEFEDEDEP